MKKNKFGSTSAFFKMRLAFGVCLCSLSLAIAVFALKKAPEQQREGEEVAAPERDMPTLGESLGDERKSLERLEQFWNDRLTYPSGKFDPAWVRAAAEQHHRMPAGVPAGSFARLMNPAPIKVPTLMPGSRKGVSTLVNTLLAPVPLSLSTSGFTALGPAPEQMTGCSGCFNYVKTQARVNTIAVDPTTTTSGSITAYVGSVGGGVWKTTNCCTTSTTWTVVTDDPLIATTSIDTITIDPNNHNTVYAGTGDLNYGSFSMGSQGILKSIDGGNTWTTLGAIVFGPAYSQPAGNYPQYNSVGKVRVDPNNSSNVAAGTKKGLYLSHDGGNTWTQCATNSFTNQRQDITGLEMSNMGGGVTRILAAVGTRGFPTFVQYDLGANGANGIYAGTMTNSGCPSFTSIASNANGFVFGAAVTGSPYTTGANMNAGSGVPCNYPISGGNATYCGNGPAGGTSTNGGSVNNLGRIDLAVAPSNPNYIYAQVCSIDWNNNSQCGNTNGCQLGVWASTDGGGSWSYMAGSQGGSLRDCTLPTGASGDYPQNWYDQGIAVDPNNPDRVFVDTFDTWFATRTGTSFFDTTCGYSYTGPSTVVHVDHHALAFLPGSSDVLLEGSDGGIFATTNASTTTSSTAPTWINMDTNMNAIEFYAGDISGNFANSSSPSAVGGAQDNGPSSVIFSGSPTGPVQWQMGLGGDGFSGQIDPIGTGQTQSQAQGTIALTTGGAADGQQFIIGTQTFTFHSTRTVAGTVAFASSTTTEGNNIVTAINADIPSTATAARSGANVIVTATTPGVAGNTIPFSNVNAANFTMDGSGTLGGRAQGGLPNGPRYWEGNNSGGLSRCLLNCTSPSATWTSSRGSWTGDTQSFVLPINLFRGGISGGDDCGPAGATTGCGHLIAATTRVWETVSGAAATVPTSAWYVTNNPTTQNLTKNNLGNRSYINQVKYSPKYQSVAIVGTNDGNVQIGFNLGTGTAAQGNWVNVTGGNTVLPDRPINGVALDPSVGAANTPVGYAAVGGFNANSLPGSLPKNGHIYQVTCTASCGSFTWVDKTGNLPDIPADCVIVNPNYPQQVFAGTDFGLFFTNDITQASPTWYRFNSGLPNVMIWDMSIDRGSTALALWTRSRGAFVYPLPSGNITTPSLLSAVSRFIHGPAGVFDLPLSLTGRTIEPRSDGTGNFTVILTFDQPVNTARAKTNAGTVKGVDVSGNTVTVNLSAVPDQQTVGVTAEVNSIGFNVNVGFLAGDVNQDGFVNVGDTILTRNNSGAPVDATHFIYDVNVDGMINVGDTSLVRANSGDYVQ
jgi:hypothetical protein